MSETADWDRWLANEDSVHALAPEGYDDDAALVRVKALWHRLKSAITTHEVSTASTELYQDSTGTAGYRVTEKADTGPFASALAWILLSHFGYLATVKDCHDLELLAKIRSVLEAFGLRYIPYDYVAGRTYNGKCAALVGFSWANRYFSLIVDFNDGVAPLPRFGAAESDTHDRQKRVGKRPPTLDRIDRPGCDPSDSASRTSRRGPVR
jgi:hypothetical protein